MIDLKDFETLLKGKQGAGFDGVGGALDYAEIAKSLGRGVWAYVVPGPDTPEPSKGTQRIEQRTTQIFFLAIYIPTQLGAKASDAIKLYHEKARDALLGWQPPGCHDFTPLEYRGANLDSLRQGGLIWVQRWAYSFYIRKDFTSGR